MVVMNPVNNRLTLEYVRSSAAHTFLESFAVQRRAVQSHCPDSSTSHRQTAETSTLAEYLATLGKDNNV